MQTKNQEEINTKDNDDDGEETTEEITQKDTRIILEKFKVPI